MARSREKVENNPTPQNNKAHKACTAKYRKAYIQAARTSWREKTEKLNLDRDGNKLWKLTKAMNDEDTKSSPVMIQRDQETMTGKSAANCFIDSYEQVSNIMIPNNRKQQVHDEIKNYQIDQDPPNYMNCPFNTKEFEEALKTLKDKKSPGPDKITNEMLEHLGTKAKSKPWESSTTAGRQGMFLRAGEKLTWYPSTRRARTEQIQTATVVLSASPVVRANSWKE